MPIDTTPPTLVSFTLPDVIDVSDGPAILSAFVDVADDESGITDAVVWFDDAFSYSFSTSSSNYTPYSLLILNDEQNTERLIAETNRPGTYSVDRIALVDGQGNERTYQAAELEELGFNTSFEIIGSTLDTTPPTLVSFTLPDVIDVSDGPAILSAFVDVADDESGITDAVVWFDDAFSYSFSTSSSNYTPYSLLILNDEQNTERLIAETNRPGTYSVDRIALVDGQGNERTYQAAELEELGFNTSFEIFSGPPSETDPSAELSFEGPIEVMEGTSVTLPLVFLNLTNADVSYQYSFSTSGASAGSADFSGGVGQDQIIVVSTSPTSRSVEIPFTALADNQAEGPENVFLDISINGAVFADGFATQRYEITLLDNVRPTGMIEISGMPLQNGMLQAGSTLADADGLGELSYQWLRDSIVVEGATSASYTLGQADVGAEISVEVSYTDGFGAPETVTSSTTSAVVNVNDAPTGSLTVSGTASVGETLSSNTATLADADGLGTLSLQWLRAGVEIAGATGSSYVLTSADAGAAITLRASYTDGQGTAESVISSATAAVLGGNLNLSGTDSSETLTGGDGNDTIAGNGGDDTINGADGDDVVSGGAGNDIVNGGDGNDETSGAAGNDIVNGGAGNDNMGGGTGNDTMDGGTGNDTMGAGFGNDSMDGGDGDDGVFGGADNDTVNGGDGNDNLAGSFGDDVLNGDQGNDDIGGGTGKDTITGGSGNDTIGGGEGDDFIQGGGGNDFLAGGGRDDNIDGGTGDDLINGGIGNDTMTGGAGDDVFIFTEYTSGDYDRITDWTDGEDVLRLTGIQNQAGTGLAGKVAALGITDSSDGALIEYEGNVILLEGISAATLDVNDFVFL